MTGLATGASESERSPSDISSLLYGAALYGMVYAAHCLLLIFFDVFKAPCFVIVVVVVFFFTGLVGLLAIYDDVNNWLLLYAGYAIHAFFFLPPSSLTRVIISRNRSCRLRRRQRSRCSPVIINNGVIFIVVASSFTCFLLGRCARSFDCGCLLLWSWFILRLRYCWRLALRGRGNGSGRRSR